MPNLASSYAHRDCAVLVASCDAYSDLWAPFFALMRRYWNDCPFQIYLGADQLPSPVPRIKVLHSDGGRDWSKCMRDYLGALTEDFVLVLLDDFFLRKTVHQTQVDHCLQFARDHEAIQVRLIPRPKPTHKIKGEKLIGASEAGSPYRLCTQAAIWNRRKLIELIQPGETIWDFERHGNARAMKYSSGFYATWRSVLPYDGLLAHHVVEKGKWLLHEKWRWGRQGIGCDFSRRQSMSLWDNIVYQLVAITSRLLTLFPWRQRQTIILGAKRGLRPFLRRRFEKMSGQDHSNQSI